MSTKCLLVIEDEATLGLALVYNLDREGYRTLWSEDGAAGLAQARAVQPDLIILDLLLPGMDGLDICRAVRRESSVPIIILTAKADEVDKIVGLEVGADDYITKPFSMRELVARVKALLRRTDSGQTKSKSWREVLRAPGLELDTLARQFSRDGGIVPLRPKEFELLSFFMSNQGVVFSRASLLDKVWGYDFAGDTRTVDVHLRWLREKVEDNPSRPTHLITVRGAGYKFEA